ncbi:hypothetical protein CYMTET_12491 [Cymbomonas tetramitiformis]|uniref:Uncharacterized protein n=1 Tax=Cymbomonas tetramitiformis TaxID=36881 RepID=A0AAE0GJY0_9CHLO|nr:hypothetical protein CYMTET_12491 [Cymbomonas tetramitiformis]
MIEVGVMLQQRKTLPLKNALATSTGFNGALASKLDYTFSNVSSTKEVVVTPMPTPAALPPGAWMLVPGTNRRATCAASYNKSGGCRTQKTSGEPQPILGSKPRVAVMAKREIEKDGVKTWKDNKLKFCVNYTCCTRVLLKLYFRVPPMPTDLPVHPEVELTAEMRNASGALTFRE